MKKIFGSILLAGVTLILAACGATANTAENDENMGVVTTIHVDYPSYDTANDLVNAADLIFSGTVESISYEDLDVRTESGTDSTTGLSSSNSISYTIYDLNAPEAYEENNGKITLSQILEILE